MTVLYDAIIGILIIFITVIPFVWKGNVYKYILIASAIICISLYIFQGYSKYQEFVKVKKENIVFKEDLNRQQKEIMQTQRTMIEKQNMFISLLNKLQKSGTISKDETRKIKNIYDETISITAKSSSKIEDRFLQAIKEAGSIEMKEAALIIDKGNNLLWALPKMGYCSWDRGTEYARNFNMGGYADWRLPSLAEAKIIIEYIKKNESTLDVIKQFQKLGFHPTTRGASFLNLEDNYYWTSESRTNNFAEAFHPHTGNIEESNKDSMKFLVLVRSL